MDGGRCSEKVFRKDKITPGLGLFIEISLWEPGTSVEGVSDRRGGRVDVLFYSARVPWTPLFGLTTVT